MHVLGRLEQVLRDEIDALKGHELDLLAEFTSRKALCLLELTRTQLVDVAQDVRPSLRRRFAALRRDIVLDQQLIATHLRAASDVAMILSKALAKANEDGTYSPHSIRAIIS